METKACLRMRKVVLAKVLFLFIFSTNTVFSQGCDISTPSFTVDLSASPSDTWTSPSVVRNGNCCGTSNPDRCVEFVLNLHPDAVAIEFDIASGAIPPGGMFYQIDCGTPIEVGDPICLNGPGPHVITFCKPGNNQNTYAITSFPLPEIGPDNTIGVGCADFIYAKFYNITSIQWNSIYPGSPGDYNSILSCQAACDTTYVTNSGNLPDYIDFEVCGADIGGCNPVPICDTIRVYFNASPEVTISSSTTHLCYNENGVWLSASLQNEIAPYTLSWSNGFYGDSIFVGPGTWIVSYVDSVNCQVYSDTLEITQDTTLEMAFAGDDQYICGTLSPLEVQLSGSFQQTNQGVWSGGSGVFTPNSNDPNASYSPDSTELAQGYSELILTTISSNGCEAHSDTIYIHYPAFDATIDINVSSPSCNGIADGSIELTTNGNFGPYLYSLNGGPLQSDSIFINLGAGLHDLLVLNSLGCDSSLQVWIVEPDSLNLIVSSITHLTCFESNDGSAQVTAYGGTPIYQFLWLSSPIQLDSVATNLTAGDYWVVVTDANGCEDSIQVSIYQPDSLSLELNGINPLCHDESTGSISSSLSGGTGPYLYTWSNGLTDENLENISSGTYVLDVVDGNGCQVSDSITLSNPQQISGSISAPQEVCPQSEVVLTVSGTGGDGEYTYSWSPVGLTGDTISVVATQNQFYSCMITDGNDCSVLLTTSVVLIEFTPGELLATVSDSLICLGESILLGGTYTGENPEVWMQWEHCISCPTLTHHSQTPTQYTTYTLTAFNQCGESIQSSVEVFVVEPPLIDIELTSHEICEGESILFSNGIYSSQNWLYEWDFGNGTTSNHSNPSYTYINAGLYAVTLTITDEYNCVWTSDADEMISVYPQAQASFDLLESEASMLDPVIHFTNTSANSNTAIWHFGDNQTTTQFHPSHTYSTHGNYTIMLIANNSFNCPDTTYSSIVINPSWELFVPNAFTPDGDDYNNVFYTKGYGIQEQGFTLRIYNRWGETLFESHDMNVGWDGTYFKDNSAVKDDVYIWTVEFRDVTNKKHERKGHFTLIR
jgi:gliding motility-associated-like protein